MIAALESNSRNYSNWIELDKIFTSRLRRVFARGAKCKDDASLFVENHRVKLSVVPPSPIPSFDVSFFYPPLPLRSCAFVPILATGTFISTRPLQPTNAYLAYTDSSLRTWKRLHYQPCLCSYSCHSLLSWFPLPVFIRNMRLFLPIFLFACWLSTVGKKSKNGPSLDHTFTFL